jgi:hypothetical protein
MFFKGSSKAFWIYLKEIMMLAVDMNYFDCKCEFLAHSFKSIHSVFAEMAAVARVNGDHDCILSP